MQSNTVQYIELIIVNDILRKLIIFLLLFIVICILYFISSMYILNLFVYTDFEYENLIEYVCMRTYISAYIINNLKIIHYLIHARNCIVHLKMKRTFLYSKTEIIR